jgi:hypothetical protein
MSGLTRRGSRRLGGASQGAAIPRLPRAPAGTRCALGILWLAVAACAGNFPPPGGPERHNPPLVLFFVPDTNAVNVRVHEASIQFDEVVGQRPQGAPDLTGLFLISPYDGEPHVGWHRSRITIRPRHGFRPNTVYTITMLPGLVDLHNNLRRTGASLTFSTGPTIPETVIRGRVFDWVAGQVSPRGFVQVFKPTDTTLVFVAQSDSNGAFVLPHLFPGEYKVRGFIDANRNRQLDRTEAWDTTHINLVDSARVEILAFVHDTIGPHITDVAVRDSVTIRLTFDRGIDTAQHVATDMFTLKGKDSALVPIARARSAAAFDSAADSAAKARADSIFRSDSARRAARGLGISDTAAARRREARITARRDSILQLRRPKMSRPSPVHEVVLELGAPLQPGAYYRVRAINVRGLLGATRTSDRVFSTPKADTTHGPTRADSLGRRRRAPVGPETRPPGAAPPSTPPPGEPTAPPSAPPPPAPGGAPPNRD